MLEILTKLLKEHSIPHKLNEFSGLDNDVLIIGYDEELHVIVCYTGYVSVYKQHYEIFTSPYQVLDYYQCVAE